MKAVVFVLFILASCAVCTLVGYKMGLKDAPIAEYPIAVPIPEDPPPPLDYNYSRALMTLLRAPKIAGTRS